MKKALFSLVVMLFAAASVNAQPVGNVTFEKFAAYWTFGSDLPSDMKAQVDLFVGTGDNILPYPGGKIALAFISYSHMSDEELRAYIEPKLINLGGVDVSLYYATMTNSMAAEVILELHYSSGGAYISTFTTNDGDSRKVTVEGYVPYSAVKY